MSPPDWFCEKVKGRVSLPFDFFIIVYNKEFMLSGYHAIWCVYIGLSGGWIEEMIWIIKIESMS